jgi:uncharacterized membrane protein
MQFLHHLGAVFLDRLPSILLQFAVGTIIMAVVVVRVMLDEMDNPPPE